MSLASGSQVGKSNCLLVLYFCGLADSSNQLIKATQPFEQLNLDFKSPLLSTDKSVILIEGKLFLLHE